MPPAPQPLSEKPARRTYDVVIAGGSAIGSSIAWFLTTHPGFGGSILVAEPDPSYAKTSTSASTSSIRQQFSSEINIRISQFGAAFIRGFRETVGQGDPEVPDITFHEFGYLYLASEAGTAILRENARVQNALGAATRLYEPDAALERWPFLNLEGIALASHNAIGEGRFDGETMFRSWRRMARLGGAEYVTAGVTGLELEKNRVAAVRLSSGETVNCGWFVNAAGPRAAGVAAMAGIALPVEPRKRTTFIIAVQDPPRETVPLLIDPSGFYVVNDGPWFRASIPPEQDPAADPDDLEPDHGLFEERLWPLLAHRIPAFEAARVRNVWAGHYAYNTLDQNAVIGPHARISNFLFANGFSGHGLQQSPAVGRGIAEWIALGRYESLDLAPLGYARIGANQPLLERNVI